MILRRKQTNNKQDNFIYKKTDDDLHNLELIRRTIMNKTVDYDSNNIELFNTLCLYGFDVKYFNLSNIIGNINYGFCIVNLNNKFILVDANYHKVYKNNIIDNPIIKDSDGIKFVNRLIVNGVVNVTNKTLNMYLNTFKELTEKIELDNLYENSKILIKKSYTRR